MSRSEAAGFQHYDGHPANIGYKIIGTGKRREILPCYIDMETVIFRTNKNYVPDNFAGELTDRGACVWMMCCMLCGFWSKKYKSKDDRL